jgi:hypothetical protein
VSGVSTKDSKKTKKDPALKNPVLSESLAREFWKNQIRIANPAKEKKGDHNG